MHRRSRWRPDVHGSVGPRLRLLALACLSAAAVVASGCILTSPRQWFDNGLKVGPNYQKPPAPVAPQWIDAKNPETVQSKQFPDAHWWTVFNDPTLGALVNTAYEQNLNLRVLGARVLEARAQQAIAAGNFFPQTQQMTGAYSRTALSRNIVNNPTVFTGLLPALGLSPTLADGLLANWYSTWSGGFNLSWELDLWGRLRRNIETANANLDASVENYDAALVTLLADAASYYVQFRVAQQQIKIAQENVSIQENILKLADQRFKVGTGTKLDVEQAKTVLGQTRSTIPVQELGLRQANNALCVVLGLPPHDLEPELGPAPEPGNDPMGSTPTWVAAGIPADLLRRRPDVRSAERQVAAQSAQIGAAEAELYPTLFVNGTLGWQSKNLNSLFESRSFAGNVTPNFAWNILNYGRIVNNVRLQDAHLQELIAAYQSKVLTAAQEVENAINGFLRAQKQTESLAESVRAATAATKIGVEQYRAGTVDFNRVFNLATTQVQQQQALAQAQGQIALNLINVYRALGGGWELRKEKGKAGAGQGMAPPAAGVEEMPAPRLGPPQPQ